MSTDTAVRQGPSIPTRAYEGTEWNEAAWAARAAARNQWALAAADELVRLVKAA